MTYFGVLSRDLRIELKDLRVNGAVRETIDDAAFGNESSDGGGM